MTITSREDDIDLILKFEEFLLSNRIDAYLRDYQSVVVKCWEVYNCTKKRCPSYGTTKTKCWHKSGSFCKLATNRHNTHPGPADCRLCSVFKMATPTDTHRINEAICNIFFKLNTLGKCIRSSKYISNKKFNTITEKFKLTPREGEVMLLILEGLSRQQIAEMLYLSLETVKVHAKKLFKKIDVKSKKDLIEKINVWSKHNTSK